MYASHVCLPLLRHTFTSAFLYILVRLHVNVIHGMLP